jgi:hypothetical protein
MKQPKLSVIFLGFDATGFCAAKVTSHFVWISAIGLRHSKMILLQQQKGNYLNSAKFWHSEIIHWALCDCQSISSDGK